MVDAEEETEAVRELRDADGSSGPMAMVSDPETGALIPVAVEEDFYGAMIDRAEEASTMMRNLADQWVPVSCQRARRRSGPLPNPLGPTRIGRKSCCKQRSTVDSYFDVAPRFRRLEDIRQFRKTRRRLILAARTRDGWYIADPGTESDSEPGSSGYGPDSSVMAGSIRADRSIDLDRGATPKPNGVSSYYPSDAIPVSSGDPGDLDGCRRGGHSAQPLSHQRR